MNIFGDLFLPRSKSSEVVKVYGLCSLSFPSDPNWISLPLSTPSVSELGLLWFLADIQKRAASFFLPHSTSLTCSVSLLGCRKKIQQIALLKWQNCVFSFLCRLQVQNQGAGRVGAFWHLSSWCTVVRPLPLSSGGLFSVLTYARCLFPLLIRTPSKEDHWELGLQHMHLGMIQFSL